MVLHSVEDVLQECARLLDMDADTVAGRGALMRGSADIKDLKDCISEELGHPLALFQQVQPLHGPVVTKHFFCHKVQTYINASLKFQNQASISDTSASFTRLHCMPLDGNFRQSCSLEVLVWGRVGQKSVAKEVDCGRCFAKWLH